MGSGALAAQALYCNHNLRFSRSTAKAFGRIDVGRSQLFSLQTNKRVQEERAAADTGTGITAASPIFLELSFSDLKTKKKRRKKG